MAVKNLSNLWCLLSSNNRSLKGPPASAAAMFRVSQASLDKAIKCAMTSCTNGCWLTLRATMWGRGQLFAKSSVPTRFRRLNSAQSVTGMSAPGTAGCKGLSAAGTIASPTTLVKQYTRQKSARCCRLYWMASTFGL
jgi:hypothetical protein